ncbi:MAG: glutaredoxin domain-containing protein [Granulosicoccus sp.]
MKILIRYFFKGLRIVLGPVLLLWSRVSSPAGIQRSLDEQEVIDKQTKDLTLYQFQTCPFCIKVKREIKRLSLNIENADVQRDQQHRQALLEGGGQTKVPCLRIKNSDGDPTWMYESGDIVKYLRDRFT